MKPRNKKYIFIAIVAAVALKFALFSYILIQAPQSIIEIDSASYLDMASAITTYFNDASEPLVCRNFRTPGYPFFLSVFHGMLKIPLKGIVFFQIILTILAAFISYKTAVNIDSRLGFLSALIILYDLPSTIYSLMVITESLFLFFISLFMFSFVLYLKDFRARILLLSALILAISVYIRPVSYFLGMAMVGFIFYANVFKHFRIRRAAIHCLIFFITVYGITGLWQYRNYKRFKETKFSSIDNATVREYGILGSYARNKDEISRGMPPLPYYLNVTSRQLMSLMTRPGNMKYFNSKKLKVAGMVVGYPLMVFWLTGFLFGLTNKRNLAFEFLTFVTLYFICISIAAITWGVSPRFRVPMMPFIAILSASGWLKIRGMINR